MNIEKLEDDIVERVVTILNKQGYIIVKKEDWDRYQGIEKVLEELPIDIDETLDD